MKNAKLTTALALCAAAVCASSCYVIISDSAKEQMRNSRVIGSGVTDSLTMTLDGIKEIKSVDFIDIVYIPSDEKKVTVVGDAAVIDHIRAEVIAGILGLRVEGSSFKKVGRTTATVRYPALERITSTGSGDIFVMEGLAIDNLTIETSGSGDIEVNGAEIASSLAVTTSGSGDARLTGKAGTASFSSTGSGDIDAAGLEAGEITKVNATGSGEVSFRENGKAYVMDMEGRRSL